MNQVRQSLIAFALVSIAVSCKPQTTSELRELGRPVANVTSCGELQYEFNKYTPLLNDGIADFAKSCNETAAKPDLSQKTASTDGADGADANAQVAQAGTSSAEPDLGGELALLEDPSSTAIASAVIPSLPAVDRTKLSGDCTNRFQYLDQTRDHLSQVQTRWNKLACNEQAASNDKIEIIDYPSCRVGCRAGDPTRACTTCQFSYVSGGRTGELGSWSSEGVPAQNKGQITCQSEADAKVAARDWCKLKGISQCDVEQISCNVANSLEPGSGTNGSTFGQTVEHSYSRDYFVRLRAKTDVVGLQVDAKVGVKATFTGSFKITISGNDNGGTVNLDGTQIGAEGSTMTCNLETAQFVGVNTENQLDVGVTFLGNGGSAGADIKLNTGTTYRDFGVGGPFSAAGKTKKEITQQCEIWANTFIETKLKTEGEAVIPSYKELNGTTVTFDVSKLGCNYPGTGEGKIARLSQVSFEIAEDNTKISYLYHLDYWADSKSNAYTVPDAEIAPYKKKLLTRAITDSEMADIFNKLVVPRSTNDGSWKVNHCGVGNFN